MGNIDISVKNFIKINSVFAQLFEQGVYRGVVTINPEELEEADTALQDAPGAGKGISEGTERLRDAERVTKLFGGRLAFRVILGIEGQTGVHYYMPVRCMELDAMSYSQQCRKAAERAREEKTLKKYADGVPKGTRIVPVVTLVFYVGSALWDGPKSVYDMLDVPEEAKGMLEQSVPDYRMNLVDARHMTYEEIDRFEGDLKAFLLMLKERFDEERLKSVVAIHRETWYALSAVKNDRRYIDYVDGVSDEELEGGVDMDAALDFIEARGEKNGIAEVNRLGELMKAAGRAGEFLDSLSDEELQGRLFLEFGFQDGKRK